MTQIQSNKQEIGQMQRNIKININNYKSDDTPKVVTSRWSNDEVMLAIQGTIFKGL